LPTKIAEHKTRDSSHSETISKTPSHFLQHLQPRCPALHIVNRDVPAHGRLNERPAYQSQQLRLQY
jgi:hypothetical protein